LSVTAGDQRGKDKRSRAQGAKSCTSHAVRARADKSSSSIRIIRHQGASLHWTHQAPCTTPALGIVGGGGQGWQGITASTHCTNHAASADSLRGLFSRVCERCDSFFGSASLGWGGVRRRPREHGLLLFAACLRAACMLARGSLHSLRFVEGCSGFFKFVSKDLVVGQQLLLPPAALVFCARGNRWVKMSKHARCGIRGERCRLARSGGEQEAVCTCTDLPP
jgi:hypothetical protein